ncbi:UNVERIFIED_CONTAM: hypothetical protein GTU68_032393 [Idotea baltica]|nr:hypothetical protein [Idotea baltica]
MNKKERYTALNKQILPLLGEEKDTMANLANVVAALKAEFGFFWVGFYRVKGEELVLGPFQGPIACTRIAKDRGVCGKAWRDATTQLVPDVSNFPGHIACNPFSTSEIVIPIICDGEVKMVLDIDSDRLDDFDPVDQEGLEVLGRIIAAEYPQWAY